MCQILDFRCLMHMESFSGPTYWTWITKQIGSLGIDSQLMKIEIVKFVEYGTKFCENVISMEKAFCLVWSRVNLHWQSPCSSSISLTLINLRLPTPRKNVLLATSNNKTMQNVCCKKHSSQNAIIMDFCMLLWKMAHLRATIVSIIRNLLEVKQNLRYVLSLGCYLEKIEKSCGFWVDVSFLSSQILALAFQRKLWSMILVVLKMRMFLKWKMKTNTRKRRHQRSQSWCSWNDLIIHLLRWIFVMSYLKSTDIFHVCKRIIKVTINSIVPHITDFMHTCFAPFLERTAQFLVTWQSCQENAIGAYKTNYDKVDKKTLWKGNSVIC